MLVPTSTRPLGAAGALPINSRDKILCINNAATSGMPTVGCVRRVSSDPPKGPAEIRVLTSVFR